QAVLVGVATGPDVFYRVPAARLALDAVVYLLMLAIYTVSLYRVEPGSIGHWEVLLYMWVLSMCFSEVCTGVGGVVGDADTERREGGTAAEPLRQRHRAKRSRRRGYLCCCSSPFLGGKFSTAVLMAAMMCRLGDYVQRRTFDQLSHTATVAYPPPPNMDTAEGRACRFYNRLTRSPPSCSVLSRTCGQQSNRLRWRCGRRRVDVLPGFRGPPRFGGAV
ncbi:unnamed protein product, partial [Ectocarpus sp. 13 AM-2016]